MELTLDTLIRDVKGSSDDPLAQLESASRTAAALDDLGDALLNHFVDVCRRSGHSWAQIGEHLGVSRQAAQQRFPDFESQRELRVRALHPAGTHDAGAQHRDRTRAPPQPRGHRAHAPRALRRRERRGQGARRPRDPAGRRARRGRRACAPRDAADGRPTPVHATRARRVAGHGERRARARPQLRGHRAHPARPLRRRGRRRARCSPSSAPTAPPRRRRSSSSSPYLGRSAIPDEPHLSESRHVRWLPPLVPVFREG